MRSVNRRSLAAEAKSLGEKRLIELRLDMRAKKLCEMDGIFGISARRARDVELYMYV